MNESRSHYVLTYIHRRQIDVPMDGLINTTFTLLLWNVECSNNNTITIGYNDIISFNKCYYL